MKAKISHYLVTRFNCGLYHGRKHTRDGLLINPQEWMWKRLILFEQFCLPSVYHQHDQDFCWLIFLDAQTPDWAKSRFDFYKKNYSNIETVYIPFGSNWPRKSISFHLKRIFKKDTSLRIISTRLDCDDALNVKAMGYIKAFAREGNYVLSFPYGYRLYGNHLKKIKHKWNPFVSRVEDNNRSVMTVHGRGHTEWSEVVKTPVKDPMWLQVVHSNNLFNYWSSLFGTKVSLSRLFQDFHFSLTNFEEIGWKI